MGGSCKGCKYSGKRHSGTQVNCNLNECIYADVIYDLKKTLNEAAEIARGHGASLCGYPVWFRNIKELVDKAAGIELKNDSQGRTCPTCKHYVLGDHGYYSCEKWDCEFEEDK